MPIYEADHIEYNITTGRVQIVLDDGSQLPAHWAHPTMGRRFPGVVLLHTWWGLTDLVRRIGNLFAQMGHYVIVPDLFNGQVATSPQHAIHLVEGLTDNGYPRVHDALSVLENHHQCNGSVAAVGIGMGGSLAFEAAIVRDDLEAAVAYGGFPHRYFGRFKQANTPIHAFYGVDEPYINTVDIKRLRKEMDHSIHKLPHKITQLPELAHDIFSRGFTQSQRERSREALTATFEFLDEHLESAVKPQRRIF